MKSFLRIVDWLRSKWSDLTEPFPSYTTLLRAKMHFMSPRSRTSYLVERLAAENRIAYGGTPTCGACLSRAIGLSCSDGPIPSWQTHTSSACSSKPTSSGPATARPSSSCDSATAVFNYVMTFQGHWVYDLNEQYPETIETHSSATEVAPYVSTVRYKSLALIDYIGTILQADPEAIIVVFGDHPPFLGQHFAAYAESDLLVPEEGKFDAAMLRTYAATPLLVIDGWRGPLELDRVVPIYALPQLLLDLIGHDATTALSLTRQPNGLVVRPIKDRTLVLDEAGTPTLCLPASRVPDCVDEIDWAELTVAARAEAAKVAV